MASEGPNSPGTAADDSSVGSVAWANPNNSKISDDVYATATIDSEQTHYLKVTNFSFAIPAGATIDGIVMEAEVKGAGGLANDVAVRIVKGGAIGSTDRSSLTDWTTTETYLSHGGISDLWGETWTAEDINASDFGVALSAGNATDTCSVDHIRITVYYTATASDHCLYSIPGLGLLALRVLPEPDASISSNDLQHLGTIYACLLASGAPAAQIEEVRQQIARMLRGVGL